MKTRKMIRGHFNMTEQKFDQIKALIGMKLTNVKVQQILNISIGTICAVKRNKDFASYKAEQKAYFDNKRLAKSINTTSLSPKEDKVIETPLYDVLVEIRDAVKDTNRLIALMGQSKKFRLF